MIYATGTYEILFKSGVSRKFTYDTEECYTKREARDKFNEFVAIQDACMEQQEGVLETTSAMIAVDSIAMLEVSSIKFTGEEEARFDGRTLYFAVLETGPSETTVVGLYKEKRWAREIVDNHLANCEGAGEADVWPTQADWLIDYNTHAVFDPKVGDFFSLHETKEAAEAFAATIKDGRVFPIREDIDIIVNDTTKKYKVK